MRQYKDTICGVEVVTKVVTYQEDALEFMEWVRVNSEAPMAVDTETTDLDIYVPGFGLRLVQFGTLKEAYVIPVEAHGSDLVEFALNRAEIQVAHNRPFDALVLEWAGFGHKLWSGHDTAILSHLLDPRGPQDGGTGQSLKRLAEVHLDSTLSDSEKALKAWATKNGVAQDDRFREAPLDLPELEHYAGLDAIMTAGLFPLFMARLAELDGQEELYKFELELQENATGMIRRGILVDEGYAMELREHLLDEEDISRELLQAQNIDNPNSTKQVREALLAAGVELVEKTDGGEFSVSAQALAHVNHPAVAPLKRYKAATKFRASYVDAMLDKRDQFGRVHPWIRSLKARTARMSISNPPLHQLPSGDALIRRILVADPGHVVYAVDYKQVELRVLAELAGETTMIDAINAGVDLHDLTAEKVGIPRPIAKMTNFLIVFGGGASALALQAGIPFPQAQGAIKGFHRVYPRVKRYGNRLQERSGNGSRPVVTPSGRRLPLDRDRTYAATNYAVQSTARDVLAQSMLSAGEEVPEITAGLWVPMHDELVGQAPVEQAEEWAARLGKVMTMEFGAVTLETDTEVYGPSWGHGYLPDDMDKIPARLRRFF